MISPALISFILVVLFFGSGLLLGIFSKKQINPSLVAASILVLVLGTLLLSAMVA
jgi:hypothetical protein